MDNGEEYAKIAEAIIEECLPIPAHRVVGKLESALAIHDAVAAERERCAQLVERMAAESPGPQGAGITVLMDTDKIAAAIRRSPALEG